MSKVETPSADTLLMCTKMVTGRCRQAESFGWHCLSWGFKGDNRETISKGNQAGSRPSKGMANKPYISVWINLGYIAIYLLSSVVVAILVFQRLYNTGCVASVSRGLTIANL
jgi:hypothetical protein